MDRALFAHRLLVELGRCIMNGIVTRVVAQARAQAQAQAQAQARTQAQAALAAILLQQVLPTRPQTVTNQAIHETVKLEMIPVDIVALPHCPTLSLQLLLQQSLPPWYSRRE